MQSVDKKYFLFNKGINTEAPLVAWPEGFTLDEQNFDLLPDGSRRRRKGLSHEAGTQGGYFTSESVNNDISGVSSTRFYRWTNVANTDEFNFVVAQIGTCLYFWNDVKSGPLGLHFATLPLEDYRVTFTDPFAEPDPLLPEGYAYYPSYDQLGQMVCSFTEIDGKLVVCGEHIEPILVEWEEGELVGSAISVEERDMFGIEDGVEVDTKPANLTDEHRYNLYCRGWTRDNIDAVYEDKSYYPAKNMIQFLGLRKQTESGYSDDSGIKVFSPDKLMGELFQNMSAPLGHVTRNVFNRRFGYGSVGQGTILKAVASVDAVDTALGRVTITCADPAHEVDVDDDIEIIGLVLKLRNNRVTKKIDFSGTGTVKEIVDANTFVVEIPSEMWDKYKIYVKTVENGQYSVGGLIEIDFDGFEPSETRFSVVSSFAGRVFYGGCPDYRIADRVYFSKVIETDKDFGKCLQEADPTSEYISDLLPTDGGYITIPNLGTLRGMVPYGRALLLFSSEGVWAIGPGEGGIFSATGYSVNKVSDAGCIAKQSIVVADNVPMYWSNAGIYAIIQDDNSGFLSAQNITQEAINELYHSIRYTEKTRVKAGYDPIRQRAFFLYNRRLLNPSNGDAVISGTSDEYSTALTPLGLLDDTETSEVTYDAALIFDLRLKAWTKWVFGHGVVRVRDIYVMPTNYDTESINGGLRFLCQEIGTMKHSLGELSSPTFEDWGYEAPCFLLTGPDSLGEPERLRYAPYVHIFMRKDKAPMVVVEQSVSGGTVAPLARPIDLSVYARTPSIFMQPRWDWARGSESGKITNYVQVYREVKPNPESFGMVVTKNKIRGRGRNLFLAFKAGTKAPAWIDGWTVKYDAQVRI